MSTPNLLLLAADKPEVVLEHLRSDPQAASKQDEHGYSLVHAAASYNHLDLLRALITDFKVSPDIGDEDNESALFVCETVEAAKVLIELGAKADLKGSDNKTARQKIEEDGEFPEVAAYLKTVDGGEEFAPAATNGIPAPSPPIVTQAPPMPEGVTVNVGTMGPEDVGSNEVDDEFRRKIEELASRPDFQGEEGQAELRRLITEAIQGTVEEERNVRARQE